MAKIGTDIEFARQLILEDEVIGLPTETVYGLAGNALSEAAISKIFRVKKRPTFDPLIAHVDSFDKLDTIVKNFPTPLRRLAELIWPGPLTLLLPKKEHVPFLLTSGLDRVAVRIPDHPLTLALLSKLTFPLAAPSANPFGYVSPTTAKHVDNQLGEKINYILDGGNCNIGLESTIIGYENEEVHVHRLGGMSLENIQDIVGTVKLDINQSSNPKAPGMLKSHYAPAKRLKIGKIPEMIALNKGHKFGIISFMKAYEMEDMNKNIILSKTGNLNEAASNLFSALRKMDDLDIDLILTELVPEEGLGLAINDRLKRASVS
ncbi:MAG: L-threonylcarbamoyladenylate synthase [Cyclobacteriaceae bacterium]|jgi:L-threonylcarbamoyladenylate synthase